MTQLTLAPVRRRISAMAWARENLFSSPFNTVLTLAALYLIWLVVPDLLDWAVFRATFTGLDRKACLGADQGACWPFVTHNLDQFIYGHYPEEERWRVDTTFILGIAGLVPLMIPRAPWKRLNALYMLGFFPLAAFVLLSGGRSGLNPVDTSYWGGFMLTLVVAVTGIVLSLPLGIVLALGRRSRLPLIRLLSVIYIEFWRGVPLVTVLFMASVMLPLFLPQGVTFDKLLRCLIGVTLFSAAYMAEVVRGGLQAIPRGQQEAASALGLGYWQSMWFIVIPQALRHVIPGIVNTFIGLFKDTTLVLVVGLFDLFGMVQFQLSDARWSTPQTPTTGYAFVAFVFWVCCFGMSRYSMSVEKRLKQGGSK